MKKWYSKRKTELMEIIFDYTYEQLFCIVSYWNYRTKYNKWEVNYLVFYKGECINDKRADICDYMVLDSHTIEMVLRIESNEMHTIVLDVKNYQGKKIETKESAINARDMSAESYYQKYSKSTFYIQQGQC